MPIIIMPCVFLLLGVVFIIISTLTTFAAPPPPSTPITLTTYTYSPTVDFQFTSPELASSTFKQEQLGIGVETNNPTGVTSYFSSIDEDTNLNHTDPVITQKINSIATNLLDSAFSPKTWGYRVSGYNPLGNIFSPIPKASAPDTVFVRNNAGHTEYFVEFGVKSGPGLTPGTYSKQVLFTTVTNHVPTTATFLPGPTFATKARTITGGGVIAQKGNGFQKANSKPSTSVNPIVVSTTDSDVPIYLWVENGGLRWWSDADTVYTNEDSSGMFSVVKDVSDVGTCIFVDMRGINTSRTKNMENMFAYIKPNNCIGSVDLSEFSVESAENMRYMFSGCNRTAGHLLNMDFSNFKASKATDLSGMFAGATLGNVDLSNFDTSHAKSMFRMFENSIVKSINLNGIDTRSVTDMHGTFRGLNGSVSNPVSLTINFDTHNVTDMALMFAEANLSSLNLSGFDTSSVKSMDWMFASVKTLTDLDLSNFDNRNVFGMQSMFSGSRSLRNINLTNFHTNSVENMNFMFQETENLTSLNLSSFDTSKVKYMENMFFGAKKLNNLDLSNFNTSNVIVMKAMFKHCESLTNVNLSGFDTSKVKDMQDMFYATFMSPENGVLDLSSFDTRSLTTPVGMFFYSKMRTIYVSDKFVTSAVSTPQDAFLSNTNLVGGNGTTYVYPNNGHTYMRIDIPGTPGYFTRKP